MSSISEKVLNEIREKKIEPKPRWQFLLKDYLVWSAFTASVIVGAVSFSVIMFVFLSNDWNLYQYLRINPLEHFVFSLPYLWVIFLLLFLALAYYNYKHTQSGYRYETYAIFGISILASIMLGLLFHFAFGIGERIDTALASNLPLYSRIHAYCNRQNIWSQPEKGLLAGEIKRIAEDDEFELEDFKGFVWQVEKDEKALMPGGYLIIAGKRVKLIGEKKAEKLFRAREIRAWEK